MKGFDYAYAEHRLKTWQKEGLKYEPKYKRRAWDKIDPHMHIIRRTAILLMKGPEITPYVPTDEDINTEDWIGYMSEEDHKLRLSGLYG